jgi:hypothetical protein
MSTGGGLISPETPLLTNTNNLVGGSLSAQFSTFVSTGGSLISPVVTLPTNTNKKNSGKVMSHLIFSDMIETPLCRDSRSHFFFSIVI